MECKLKLKIINIGMVVYYLFFKQRFRNMCHTLIFVLNKKIFFTVFWPFFGIFLILTSTQTTKVINLIFFNELALNKLGYEHAFQPYTYSLRPFLYIDSDPPVFIGLKTGCSIEHGNFLIRLSKTVRAKKLWNRRKN